MKKLGIRLVSALVLMLLVQNVIVLAQDDIFPTPLLDEAPQEVQDFYTPGDFSGQTLDVVINASYVSREYAMENARLKFEELSGATVNYIPLPENQMYDQVRLELATQSGAYDMMHTGAGGAKEYGLGDFLIPLPTPPDIDDFYEGDVAQYSIGGELYGMPFVADTNILYWRTDLFEEAGLDPNDPPETYDELREYALLLTTDVNGNHPGDEGFDLNNIEVYGLGFKGVAGLASSWEWYNYLYAFGGDLFDEDYNVIVDSPEAVASLQWVVDNFREYNIYPADTPTYDYTEYHTLFVQGRMAMAINWPYMYSMAQDPEQSNVVGQVAVGRKPGQVTHGGNIGGWSWNVFQMSDNQDLAIAFANWMSGPDVAMALAERYGFASARASVAELMTEIDPVLYGAIGVNQADGRSVAWQDAGPSWLAIEDIQSQAIQEALIGTKTAEEALTDAKAEIVRILDDNEFYTELLPRLLSED